MKAIVKALINLVFLLSAIIVNMLGARGSLSGLTQKQISDKYLTMITSDPMTYRIWFLIYGLILISLIVMLLQVNRGESLHFLQRFTLPFRLNCLFCIGWMFAFSYERLWISVALIYGLLATAVILLLRIQKMIGKEYVLHSISFGLYSGWVFIQTISNVATALNASGWDGFGLPYHTWSLFMMFFGIVLVLMFDTRIKNAAFPLATSWYYYGLYRYLRSDEGYGGGYKLNEYFSSIGVAAMLVFAVVLFIANNYRIYPKPHSKA